MKLDFSKAEEEFRAECADWLNAQMAGEFSDIKGISTLTAKAQRRKEWEQHLGAHGWGCIGWPKAWGGRDASLAEQVIFAEEYARAGVPGRVNHIGIELAGPTLLAFGTDEQKNASCPILQRAIPYSVRGFPSPAQDRILRACAPRGGSKTDYGSLTARKSGRALRISPTGYLW